MPLAVTKSRGGGDSHREDGRPGDEMLKETVAR
jgi:hypothetical protein